MKKRMTDWWNEPLEHWSSALGFDYQVLQGFPNGHPHPIGSWWQDGDEWCTQLGGAHWLKLQGFEGGEDVKTALSWTLRTVYRTTHKDWKQIAVEQLTRFASEDHEALMASWMESVPETLNPSAPQIPSGYFAWIHFDHNTSLDHPFLEHDIRASIEEVVQAFFPNQVLGWTWVSHEVASLLVYCSIPNSDEEWSTDEERGTVSAPANQVLEQKWLRSCLSEMLDMLAADAMVWAKVSVSCRVSDYSQIQKGLISVVNAHRGKRLLAQSTRIVIWGEDPWMPLVQGLPAAAVDQFVEVASLRTEDGELYLNDELLATLHGVIAANLNVSEAARLLYLHRNTLLNRIERIRQQTGYDIRTFQDAFVLWMVHILRPTIS